MRTPELAYLELRISQTCGNERIMLRRRLHRLRMVQLEEQWKNAVKNKEYEIVRELEKKMKLL